MHPTLEQEQFETHLRSILYYDGVILVLDSYFEEIWR